jgi:hypothetical protein
MYTVAADLQAPPTDAIDVKELSRFRFASLAPSGDPKQRSPRLAGVPPPRGFVRDVSRRPSAVTADRNAIAPSVLVLEMCGDPEW